MMNNIYHRKLQIPCYDTDASQLLKPVSFMNYAQEMANRHASVLGFGYDDMTRTRTAWVLSRMHIKFLRHPVWRDEVNLRTWHKGPENLFYLRDFRMTDASDAEELAVATTSWLVVNIDTHRLVRETVLDESSELKEDAISPSCEKIRIPSGMERAAVVSHRVAYSDLDTNGHTNNAMYVAWAMDALDCGITLERPLKELKINFNRETKAGETVEISVFPDFSGENPKYWVEGRVGQDDKVQSFVAELVF